MNNFGIFSKQNKEGRMLVSPRWCTCLILENLMNEY